MTTLDEVHRVFSRARENWLNIAEAHGDTRSYYINLSVDDFYDVTYATLVFIDFEPSLIALREARTAAKVFLIAREQGLNQAMIWKLANV